MSDVTWGIGTAVDLNQAGFRLLRRGTIWRPDISTRHMQLELPARHGHVQPWSPPVYEAPIVTLLVGANATTMATLEEARQRLEALLTGPTGVLLTRTSGAQAVHAVAQLVGVNESGWMVDGWWRLQILLRVPGVFFYGASVDQSLALSGTQVLPALAGSTAPNGALVVRLTGPASSVVLTDPITGEGVSWTGSLPAGTSLFVDVARMAAWTGDWSGGPSRSHEVDFPPAGPLQLWPEIQPDMSRRVRVSVTTTGTGTGSALVLRAAPAYF